MTFRELQYRNNRKIGMLKPPRIGEIFEEGVASVVSTSKHATTYPLSLRNKVAICNCLARMRCARLKPEQLARQRR